MSDSGSRWRRYKEVSEQLDRALELPFEERFAFLSDLREEDDALASEVETLLAAEGEMGPFLDGAAAAQLAEESSWLGRRLGPYELVELLGRGGMGEIYRGHDQRLDRAVAIKVLSSSTLFSAKARERFSREARAVAALDHPNVCTLHDIGTSEEGELYLVMAHYSGQTLKERLASGPLPLGDALEVAAAIAEGLAHAHGAGIAHRDIKPGNVMLTEGGGVKVLDFGIAKLDHEKDLTGTGQSLGTPAYMAPEQILGEGAGPSTDIWALGAVTHEMLSGSRPFASQGAELRSILESEPPDLESCGVPAEVAELVGEMLIKRPERRPQDAAHLAERLNELRGELVSGTLVGSSAGRRPRLLQGSSWKSLAGAAFALLALWGLFQWTSDGSHGPGPSPGVDPSAIEHAHAQENPQWLAVLPFENQTPKASNDVYAAGLTALLRDSLSSSRHVRVLDPRRGLGSLERGVAAASVRGEVLQGSDGLLLAVRVIDTRSREQLWGTRIQAAEGPALYSHVDELDRDVRRALKLPTDEAVDVFAADFASQHPGAYDQYLRGLKALTIYEQGAAMAAFEKALEIAPDFTMARFRLAQVLGNVGRTKAASEHMGRAVSESPSLGEREAAYIRATAHLVERRYEDAAAGFTALLARFPYEVDAHHLLAMALRGARRGEEALAVLETLNRIEPEAAVGWSLRGETLLALGRPQEALEALERYLEIEPASANGHHLLGDAYRVQGQLELAAASYERALELDEGFRYSKIELAVVEAMGGEENEAILALETVIFSPEALPRQRLDAVFVAVALLRGQGRCRLAFEWLEAVEDLLREEWVRFPLALTERALCRLELGDSGKALALAREASQDPPGRPFRYLFVRALAELESSELAAFESTVAELLSFENEETATRSATYLSGLRRLRDGDAAGAIASLRRASTLEGGYVYANYRTAFARALLESGRWREAEAVARAAMAAGEPVNPRFDLNLGRSKARLLLARAEVAMGRLPAAEDHLSEMLATWRHADPGFRPLREVEELAAEQGILLTEVAP